MLKTKRKIQMGEKITNSQNCTLLLWSVLTGNHFKYLMIKFVHKCWDIIGKNFFEFRWYILFEVPSCRWPRLFIATFQSSNKLLNYRCYCRHSYDEAPQLILLEPVHTLIHTAWTTTLSDHRHNVIITTVCIASLNLHGGWSLCVQSSSDVCQMHMCVGWRR